MRAGFTTYFRFVAAQQNAFRVLFGGGARRDSEFDRAAGHVRRYGIASLHHVDNRNRLIVGRHTYWGLPLIPLLILRRLWALGRTHEEVIATGLSDRGTLMNHLLLLLSGCEWIPQRLLGTSLMAVFEAPSDGDCLANAQHA